MTLDTFIEHLDRYGPDLDRWPVAVRPSGRAFEASSKQAAAAVAEARRLAEILAGLPDRPAPAHLAARIAARAVPGEDLWTRLDAWFRRALWRPALAASVPLALGFVLGLSDPQGADTDDAYLLETIALLPFSQRFEELPDEE